MKTRILFYLFYKVRMWGGGGNLLLTVNKSTFSVVPSCCNVRSQSQAAVSAINNTARTVLLTTKESQ